LKESDILHQKDVIHDNGIELPQSTACDLLNDQLNEIRRLKSVIKILKMDGLEQIEDYERIKKEADRLYYILNQVLYQIGHMGYNNKQCKGCVSYLPDIKYCKMYDMDVDGEGVIIECDNGEWE